MLARISSILGPMPPKVLDAGRDTPRYYTMNHVVYERVEPAAEVGEAETDEADEADETDETEGGDAEAEAVADAANRARRRARQAPKANSFMLLYPKKTTLEDRLHLPQLKTSLVDPVSGRRGKDQWVEERLFCSFVRSLLDLDPTKRPTATEALQHPWLQGADDFDLKKLNDEEGRWDAAKLQRQEQEGEDDGSEMETSENSVDESGNGGVSGNNSGADDDTISGDEGVEGDEDDVVRAQ